MCTMIARLAEEHLEMFGFNVAFPAIVTDCGANIRKAFNNTLQWDWLRCGRHFIHDVFTAGFVALRNNAHNPAQTETRKCQQALDRWEMWIIVTQCIVFFKNHEKYWELGIRYRHWLCRPRSFVCHVKRSSKASEELRALQKQQMLKGALRATTRLRTPRKTRKKRMREIFPMRNV